MTMSPITIEPMHAKYNPQVGRLTVQGFRGLTNMKGDELAFLFEWLLDHFPTEAGSQRMVALQEGKVLIGLENGTCLNC